MKKLRSILLVDDNTDENYMHRRLIRRARLVETEAHLKVCHNGREAIDHLVREEQQFAPTWPPQLVLLDINMPILDGWGVLDWASGRPKTDWEDTVFILLSSSLATADRQRALTYPLLREFVTKPLTANTLNELVARHF